jgi:hypothetical protein
MKIRGDELGLLQAVNNMDAGGDLRGARSPPFCLFGISLKSRISPAIADGFPHKPGASFTKT